MGAPSAEHPFSSLLFVVYRGLKTVDIQAECPVEFGELPRCMFPNQTIITDALSHNGSIFLFQKKLISFL